MKTETNFTIASVRRELPDVKVKLRSGRVVTGHVCGRQLEQPEIWLDGELAGLYFHAAWSTIAHCLNTDAPILL